MVMEWVVVRLGCVLSLFWGRKTGVRQEWAKLSSETCKKYFVIFYEMVLSSMGVKMKEKKKKVKREKWFKKDYIVYI